MPVVVCIIHLLFVSGLVEHTELEQQSSLPLISSLVPFLTKTEETMTLVLEVESTGMFLFHLKG